MTSDAIAAPPPGLPELVRRLVAGELISAETLDEHRFRFLLGEAVTRGLEGSMWSAHEAGRLALTEAQLADVIDRAIPPIAACVALESLALHVIELLEAEGIEPCVLKGIAAAHLDHELPWTRQFGDIDLLVKPRDLDRTYAVLEHAGFTRRFGEPRPGFDRRFSKGCAFTRPDGRTVDVHRTLAMGALGLSVDLDELWADLDEFDLAGRQVRALGPERRFLHACVHAAAGQQGPKRGTLRDITALARRPLDTDVIERLARRWHYQAVVTTALDMTSAVAGPASTAPLVDLRDRLAPTRWETFVLRAYARPRSGYAGRSLLGLREIRRWRDRGAFVWALVFPTATYRARHGARWRRLLTNVTAMARRPR